MNNVSFKIAVPIIITGIFIIIIFVALNYQFLNQGIYIVFFFLCVYVFLFGFATGQNFASPVKKLLKRATELSEGDLKTRVYLETKDEFGELSRVFNKIAQDLEESRQAGSRAEESIDIKVKARTQVLEETINALEQKVRNRTAELDRVILEFNKKDQEIQSKEQEIARLKSEVENANKKAVPETQEEELKKTVNKKLKTAKSDFDLVAEKDFVKPETGEKPQEQTL